MVLVFIAVMLGLASIWQPLRRLGGIITLFLGMVYFAVLINTVYYGVMGLSREDLSKASIWTKKY
jgi:hypothetical protein